MVADDVVRVGQQFCKEDEFADQIKMWVAIE